jgi:hypothetical protein
MHVRHHVQFTSFDQQPTGADTMSNLETELALQNIAAQRLENPEISRSEAEAHATRFLVGQGFGQVWSEQVAATAWELIAG